MKFYEKELFNTCLYYLARRGHEESIRCLLELGADPNSGKYGLTPLMMAAFHGHSAIVSLLLEYGANVFIRHPCGMPLIELALCKKDKQTLEVLQRNGCRLFDMIEYTSNPSISSNIIKELVGFKDSEDKSKYSVETCTDETKREPMVAFIRNVDSLLEELDVLDDRVTEALQLVKFPENATIRYKLLALKQLVE
jgi:ankyrin repeat protein